MNTLLPLVLGLVIGGATAGILALRAATEQLREHNEQLSRLLAVTEGYRDHCDELTEALDEAEAELRLLQGVQGEAEA
jgi:hypothetical protein